MANSGKLSLSYSLTVMGHGGLDTGGRRLHRLLARACRRLSCPCHSYVPSVAQCRRSLLRGSDLGRRQFHSTMHLQVAIGARRYQSHDLYADALGLVHLQVANINRSDINCHFTILNSWTRAGRMRAVDYLRGYRWRQSICTIMERLKAP